MENRKETTAAPTPQVDYDDMAEAIDGVLSAVPMTAAEINAALGTDYEALQVANAVKSIPGAGACKIRRMTTNIRGETGRRAVALSGVRLDLSDSPVWAQGRRTRKKLDIYPAMWAKPRAENTVFVRDVQLKHAKPYALKTLWDSLSF